MASTPGRCAYLLMLLAQEAGSESGVLDFRTTQGIGQAGYSTYTALRCKAVPGHSRTRAAGFGDVR